jgi:hypothetical protein
MAKEKPDSPFSVEVAAKASLEASISTEIPRESSGRLLDALTDLLRPISERRGLRADQIRLQREQVLIEIASKARKRLALESAPVSPIPNKFLVPFLERASLEEEGNELSDRWADLLVRAATAYTPGLVRFTAVLSEIGPGEAAFLKKIIYQPRSKLALSLIEDVPIIFISGRLEREVCELVEPTKSVNKLAKRIISRFELSGSIWPFLGISKEGDVSEYPHPTFGENEEAIASNLVSLGVLHFLDGLEGTIGELEWFGRAYGITQFGLRFVQACDQKLRTDLAAVANRFRDDLADLEAREE